MLHWMDGCGRPIILKYADMTQIHFVKKIKININLGRKMILSRYYIFSFKLYRNLILFKNIKSILSFIIVYLYSIPSSRQSGQSHSWSPQLFCSKLDLVFTSATKWQNHQLQNQCQTRQKRHSGQGCLHQSGRHFDWEIARM